MILTKGFSATILILNDYRRFKSMIKSIKQKCFIALSTALFCMSFSFTAYAASDEDPITKISNIAEKICGTEDMDKKMKYMEKLEATMKVAEKKYPHPNEDQKKEVMGALNKVGNCMGTGNVF